jgi:FkbM family methyltransferase
MLPSSVRRLSYNPIARTIAQRLHVGGFARRIYCRLLSSNGVLRFSCLGVEASFSSHNRAQMGFTDCVITTEKNIIEETLSNLRVGDTFLDVGCNFGAYSVVASKLVGGGGRVIAVDPHPATVEILRENLKLNGCENVEVLNVAFTDSTGLLSLSFGETNAHLHRSDDLSSPIQVVQGIAGDEALVGLPAPAVVKVDVEGHEFAVLCGLKETLSSSACRVLCVEIHPQFLPAGVDENRILKFIRDCGFSSVKEHPRASMGYQSLRSVKFEFLVIAHR